MNENTTESDAVQHPARLPSLSKLIWHLYEGALQDTRWRNFLAQLRLSFQADVSLLTLRRSAGEDLGVFFIDGMEVSEEHNRYYASQISAHDPFSDLPDGEVHVLTDLACSEKMKAQPYYRDYLLPMGLTRHVGMAMAINIYHHSQLRLMVRIVKKPNAPAFSENDRATLRLLEPHLRQLVVLLDRLSTQHTDRVLLDTALDGLAMGAILLDKHLRISRMTPLAEYLVKGQRGLRIVNRQLRAEHTLDQQRLKQRLQQCIQAPAHPNQAISIRRQQGMYPLTLVIRALTEHELANHHETERVVIFINAPELRTLSHCEILQEIFCLTPSEATLAIALANGKSLDDLARELSLSRNTLRSQLRSVFQKSGVNQQSALVSLVLRSVYGIG